MSREKDRRFDEEMDKSLQVGLKRYAAMLDKAYAAADRLFADQRNEDANAVLDLIVTGWELFKMQDDVLSLTRNKYRADLTWSEQRVHDRLQSLKRPGFVLVDEKANEARRRRDNEARLKKARADAQRQNNARNERTGMYPSWMRDLVKSYVMTCQKKPSAAVALDKIKTHARSIGYNGADPTRQAVQKWIDKFLQPSGR